MTTCNVLTTGTSIFAFDLEWKVLFWRRCSRHPSFQCFHYYDGDSAGVQKVKAFWMELNQMLFCKSHVHCKTELEWVSSENSQKLNRKCFVLKNRSCGAQFANVKITHNASTGTSPGTDFLCHSQTARSFWGGKPRLFKREVGSMMHHL